MNTYPQALATIRRHRDAAENDDAVRSLIRLEVYLENEWAKRDPAAYVEYKLTSMPSEVDEETRISNYQYYGEKIRSS